MSEMAMLRQPLMNRLAFGDAGQFFVKSTGLEEVDERELPHHQPNDGQEDSTRSIVNANDAAKTVEPEQFRFHNVSAGDRESTLTFNM
jgi:hypothetical protein